MRERNSGTQKAKTKKHKNSKSKNTKTQKTSKQSCVLAMASMSESADERLKASLLYTAAVTSSPTLSPSPRLRSGTHRFSAGDVCLRIHVLGFLAENFAPCDLQEARRWSKASLDVFRMHPNCENVAHHEAFARVYSALFLWRRCLAQGSRLFSRQSMVPAAHNRACHSLNAPFVCVLL